jgi:hypothetical protein
MRVSLWQLLGLMHSANMRCQMDGSPHPTSKLGINTGIGSMGYTPADHNRNVGFGYK